MATVVVCAGAFLCFAVSGEAAASTRPVVTSVAPSYGPSAGGTTVGIVGKNFTGATAVDFGTVPATTFVVNSSSGITATSPPGVGVVNVVVTTPVGTTKTNSNDKFNYGPNITCPTPPTGACPISPSYGPPAGGTDVTITGTNFTGATGVNFGSTTLTPGGGPPASGEFTIVSDTEIIANSPSGSGVEGVSVVTPGGTSHEGAGDTFNYGPSITCPTPPTAGCPVSPSFGPPAGGTIVTLSGTNFTGATGVNFGTAALTSTLTNPPPPGNFFFMSDTEIIANSPSGTGVVNVIVTTLGGTSPISNADRFSYAPILSSISPATGPATGGTTVMLTGSNFTGATAVNFGTKPASSFVFNSDTSITATSPPGKSPSVTVTVTTPGGTSPAGSGTTFGYGPVVALLKPSVGVGAGGTKVEIVGTDFKAVTAVDFGTSPADSFKLKSSGELIAFAPAGTGIVDVTVISAAGSSALVPADHFDYAPTVTGVSPGSGKATGGLTVTLRGTNFSGVTGVEFGTSAASTFTVQSAKKMKAVAPPGAGTVDVTVITLGGTSPITPSDHFNYR